MNKDSEERTGHGCAIDWDSYFYGAATVGERGQIVIPAEARASLNIRPGDKLIIMRHPHYAGLMISKFETIRDFLDEFAENLEKAAGRSREEVEE